MKISFVLSKAEQKLASKDIYRLLPKMAIPVNPTKGTDVMTTGVPL
jgi:hypothetical protein